MFFVCISQDEKIEYCPGNTIGILPVNSEEDVCEVVNRIVNSGCFIDEIVRLRSVKKKLPQHLPTAETTIHQILRECVDLRSIPKKAFLQALLRNNCISDPAEHRFIEILGSREGSGHYISEILEKGKSFLSILEECESLTLTEKTIGILFEHLARLTPRPYSISSSPLSLRGHGNDLDENFTEVKIVFSVNQPPGLVTSQLKQAAHDPSLVTHVNVYFRKENAFQLRDDQIEDPLIMIAAGTGLAPFLGFLEHRKRQLLLNSNLQNGSSGHTWLFYGCRKWSKQLCGDDLREYVKAGCLNELTEAFSRDAAHEKSYVQNEIVRKSARFIPFFVGSHDAQGKQCEENSTVTYVCGSLAMCKEVRATIERCLVDESQCTATEAKEIVDKMVLDGRYNEDIWL